MKEKDLPKDLPEDFKEEVERVWADLKARDAQRAAEFDALPEAERKRLEKELIDPAFDRFSEDPLGSSDDEYEDDEDVKY